MICERAPVSSPCAKGLYAMREVPPSSHACFTPFFSGALYSRLYCTWLDARLVPRSCKTRNEKIVGISLMRSSVLYQAAQVLSPARQQRGTKYYTCRHQFNEKPCIIPGCPGPWFCTPYQNMGDGHKQAATVSTMRCNLH